VIAPCQVHGDPILHIRKLRLFKFSKDSFQKSTILILFYKKLQMSEDKHLASGNLPLLLDDKDLATYTK
jgi:hypothetical protein